jgi:hypothetical protein
MRFTVASAAPTASLPPARVVWAMDFLSAPPAEAAGADDQCSGQTEPLSPIGDAPNFRMICAVS